MPADSTTSKTPRKAQAKKTAPPATVEVGPLPDSLGRPDLHAVPTPEPEQLPEGAVRVPLGDGSVVVPDRDDWPCSANEDLATAMYRSWAGKVLSDADFAYWLSIDPTNRMVGEFFVALHEARYGEVDTGTALRAVARLNLA